MNTLHMMAMASWASAGMFALGCEHTDDRNGAASAPQPTTAQARSVDGATVDRLSSARCDREQDCNNIGDGKKYASRQVCTDQFHGSIANDLNSYKCPGGLDPAAVQRCLAAIGNEECGVHPLESLTRIDDCRSGAMCLK
ncbi:MAG: DUF6184 family natural product biosynthesis lipoprotein [Polyangiaceae bacterium]